MRLRDASTGNPVALGIAHELASLPGEVSEEELMEVFRSAQLRYQYKVGLEDDEGYINWANMTERVQSKKRA